MTVFSPHTRVISFRIPENEYESLRKISDERGAHSISDYARWMVRQGLEAEGVTGHASLPDQVRSLTLRVDELTQELSRLRSSIGTSGD